MTDEETLKVYDAKVSDYQQMTRRAQIDPDLLRFMAHLPSGALVLDLGCGPATASAVMREHGYRPDPVDASGEMVRFANEAHAINARLASFDEIDSEATYDGIWANFSLLHAQRAQMPNLLKSMHRAVKGGGLFHIGMKLGEGESRDSLGRFYTYYSQEQLNALLEHSGFKPIDHTLGEGGGLSGEITPWITVLSRAV